MKISACFPSKYVKAADLHDQQVKAIMDYVEMEDIGDADPKPVLYFQNAPKGLVINKTNAKVISGAYGDETGGWKDKTIILFPVMVDFRGESVEAVRVKLPSAKDRIIAIKGSATPEADSEQMMEAWGTRQAEKMRNAMRGGREPVRPDADGVVWEDAVERPATVADKIVEMPAANTSFDPYKWLAELQTGLLNCENFGEVQALCANHMKPVKKHVPPQLWTVAETMIHRASAELGPTMVAAE